MSTKEQTKNNLKTEQKRPKNNIYFIIFQPFLQISHQTILALKHTITKEITFQKPETIAETTNEMNFGLDCSGQGQCQPNIEPSAGQEMQKFLVKRNKRKRQKSAEKSASGKNKKSGR